ncbi:YdbL family protein [Erythrobacter colymbi]|uniref:YdbL family protein n=1 Tax=Erythrobacter colymbi TaxID=1161202 RepID=UPI00197F26BF|nr:YdbL family protein [Erythrobacter colymbi]
MMRSKLLAGIGAAAVLAVLAVPALAQQRDPAYAAAREAGKVGEKPDGYLGIVGAADPALQRLVDDINIKRKAIYMEKAREQNATPEAYALTAGCQAIARTVPGEKYMAPDGTWQTRTSAPPVRDQRCP